MAIQMKAGIRKVAGKGAARAVRNNQNVPAVIYGEKKDAIAIEIDAHFWNQLIRKPALRTKLFEIETPNGVESAMLIDIQYHPVTDNPIHIDFKRIDVKKPVNVVVPIEIANLESSRGIKSGGALNFAVRKVAIVAKVDDIPEKITIDLANLGIGETVHGSDLNLPNGVSLGLRQSELAFVTITGKMAEETDVKTGNSGADAAKNAAAAKTAAPAKK